jgi:hypothetical protein
MKAAIIIFSAKIDGNYSVARYGLDLFSNFTSGYLGKTSEYKITVF